MRLDALLPSRRAWGLILALSALWFAFIIAFGSRHATLSPGWADEVSHLYTTWIFWDHKFEIFKQPTEVFLGTPPVGQREVSLAASLDLPPTGFYAYPRTLEISTASGAHSSQPIFIVSPNVPRPYPPGLYLLFTPVSWLVSLDWLSPQYGILLMTALGLIAAHLAIWILLQAFLQAVRPESLAQTLFIGLVTALCYAECLRWTLNSQYDILAVLLLLCFVIASRTGRPFLGLILYALAFFLHLRALIFMPWAAWTFYEWMRASLRQKNFAPRHVLGIAIGLLLVACSALTLLWNAPYFKNANLLDLNSMHWSKLGPGNWGRTLTFASGFLVVLYFWWRQRMWGALACSAWCVILLMQSRLMREWYTLFLLPFFALTLLTANEDRRARLGSLATTLGFYTLIAALFMNNSPFEFRLVREVAAAVAGGK